MAHIQIKSIEPLNHNVHRYRTTKPAGFTFEPGQATELSILKDGWRDKRRPFTFTSLPGEDELEFTIKSYPDHDGVTLELSRLLVGDKLEIGDPWGAITYKGPGTFIAGGAGVTPFLAIFKQLAADPDCTDVNRLFFANKTERDIFAEDALAKYPRLDVHHILSEEDKPDYAHGIIDRSFLEGRLDDFKQRFYLCGPPQMVNDVSEALKSLGAKTDTITFEE
jgi:ferredoxin-NADP reductase